MLNLFTAMLGVLTVPDVVEDTITDLGTAAGSVINTMVLPAVAICVGAWIFVRILKRGGSKIG